MIIYTIIGLAIGFFIGMVVFKITTGNCKIIKKFKKSGETDLYKYIMENETDQTENKNKE